MGPDGDASYDAFSPAVSYGSRSNNHLIVFNGDDDTPPLVDEEFEIFGQLYGDSADLVLVKTDLSDPVDAGSSATYLIIAGNGGPNKARFLTLTDTLPPGTMFDSVMTTGRSCGESGGTLSCTLSELSPGLSPFIYVTLDVDPATSGTISNTAIVTSDTFDPDSSNDMMTESTSVNPTPTPTPTPTPAPVTCKLEVKNKKCKKKKRVKRGTRCRFETSVFVNSAPQPNAPYTLQRRIRKKPYKDFKSDTTDSSGAHTVKLQVKKPSTYKSSVTVSGQVCETSEIKLKVRKKR